MLFKTVAVSSAGEGWLQKRFDVAMKYSKVTLWWNQEVKYAIRVNKSVFEALFQIKSKYFIFSKPCFKTNQNILKSCFKTNQNIALFQNKSKYSLVSKQIKIF